MKLKLEDVKKITAGALEITENDGVFTFCRFEKEAMDHYAGASAGFCLKAVKGESAVIFGNFKSAGSYSFYVIKCQLHFLPPIQLEKII